MNVSAHIKVDKAAFFRFVASQAEGRFEYDKGADRTTDDGWQPGPLLAFGIGYGAVAPLMG